MLSNYPPGVTGFEDEIAGPLFQHESQEYCRHCDDFQDGFVTGWSTSVDFECGFCGKTSMIEDGSNLLEYDNEELWAVGGC